MTYTIVPPIQGQPASASLFGLAVKNAINDLDSRVSALEGTAPGLVAWHQRTASSASSANNSSAEYSVMRMDGIPVLAGYSYEIVINRCTIAPDVANVAVTTRIRAAQGAVATTANNSIGYWNSYQQSTSLVNGGPMVATFNATANSTLSVLATMKNATASGHIVWTASTAEPLNFYVKLIGPSIADYGTGADLM